MSSAVPGRPSGMGELVITTFMTLDGVMQAPGGRDEDREDGFEHGGWQAPVSDPASGERMLRGVPDLGRLPAGPPDIRHLRVLLAEPAGRPVHPAASTICPGTSHRARSEGRLGRHDHPRRRRRAAGRRDQGAPRADRALGQRRPRPDAAAPRPRRPPRSLDLSTPPGHGQAHLRRGHRPRSVPPDGGHAVRRRRDPRRLRARRQADVRRDGPGNLDELIPRGGGVAEG